MKVKKRASFCTPAKKNEIVRLEGFVSGNPVKSAFYGSSYKTEFSVSKAFTKNGAFSACGKLNLFFPSEFVEAFYPGKIYSSVSGKSCGGFLVESGAVLSVEVVHIQKSEEISYLVKGGKSLGWKGGFLGAPFRKFRALCRLQFKRLMYSWGEAGGLLLALLSGSREYTEKSVSDAFRDSGLSHILALSGMHLGLFGSLAHFFGKKAGGRNFGDALQLGAVLFFVWFAGISPSLFRAFLAALILYLNSLFRMNRPDSLSLLSSCFLIHVMIFPAHIFEPAFMLSYSSLAGIILFGMFLRKVYPFFIPYRTRLSISDSTAAQIATSPVSIKIFGKIMPVGIAASLFVSPLVFLFLYLGLFGVMVCLVLPFLSGAFCDIMNLLYFLIKKFVLFFGNFRGIEF
ncbi:MAG: ComEC/Rec2 family competence protein [Treponema sp.]|nr:ComEC/Rec2 family competence protein [Treponema sp.]